MLVAAEVFGTNPTIEKEGRYGLTRVYRNSDYSRDEVFPKLCKLGFLH